MKIKSQNIYNIAYLVEIIILSRFLRNLHNTNFFFKRILD